ncbi:type II CAAX prenyl endopeptidase Rce1 family protein [Weissella diestrammenae]
MYRFKGSLVRLILMVTISSILFGLIHINNFGGSVVATIPYMFVGLYLSLIYLRTNNIWHNIMTYFIFNTSALMGIVLMWYVNLT